MPLPCRGHSRNTVNGYDLASIYYVSGKDTKLLLTQCLILTITRQSIISSLKVSPLKFRKINYIALNHRVNEQQSWDPYEWFICTFKEFRRKVLGEDGKVT